MCMAYMTLPQYMQHINQIMEEEQSDRKPTCHSIYN